VIVIRITAIVVAEFFIHSATNVFTATETNFGFCYHMIEFDGRLQTVANLDSSQEMKKRRNTVF
jgi:hypothetical protein